MEATLTTAALANSHQTDNRTGVPIFLFQTIEKFIRKNIWEMRQTRWQIPVERLLFLIGGAYVRLRREWNRKALQPNNSRRSVQWTSIKLSKSFSISDHASKGLESFEEIIAKVSSIHRRSESNRLLQFLLNVVRRRFSVHKNILETSTQHDLWTPLCKSFSNQFEIAQQHLKGR